MGEFWRWAVKLCYAYFTITEKKSKSLAIPLPSKHGHSITRREVWLSLLERTEGSSTTRPGLTALLVPVGERPVLAPKLTARAPVLLQLRPQARGTGCGPKLEGVPGDGCSRGSLPYSLPAEPQDRLCPRAEAQQDCQIEKSRCTSVQHHERTTDLIQPLSQQHPFWTRV